LIGIRGRRAIVDHVWNFVQVQVDGNPGFQGQIEGTVDSRIGRQSRHAVQDPGSAQESTNMDPQLSLADAGLD
jgi:hypothetical protein